MVLYSTTRWVGIYYEIGSLLPFEFIVHSFCDSPRWTLKYGNMFWYILKDIRKCLVPIKAIMEKAQAVLTLFSSWFFILLLFTLLFIGEEVDTSYGRIFSQKSSQVLQRYKIDETEGYTTSVVDKILTTFVKHFEVAFFFF